MFLLVDEGQSKETAKAELLVSVSKRYFKRAVKRNRVKRQIREAYRKNKFLLAEVLERMPHKKLLLAVIWQDAHLYESAKVESKMQVLLRRVADKLLKETEDSSCS